MNEQQPVMAKKISIIEDMVELYPDLLEDEFADRIYAGLLDSIDWQQEQVNMFGKVHPVPRLIAWYGDTGVNYRYSGIDHVARNWSRELLAVKPLVEQVAVQCFNGVLLNLYRNGSDRMGWHSDDEKSLGTAPVIASLSLGAKRRFSLRQKQNHRIKRTIDLPHGSLLLMRGLCQQQWQHQLHATKKAVKPRINLTFRFIKDL